MLPLLFILIIIAPTTSQFIGHLQNVTNLHKRHAITKNWFLYCKRFLLSVLMKGTTNGLIYFYEKFHTNLHLLQIIIHTSHNYVNKYFVDKGTLACKREYFGELKRAFKGKFEVKQIPLGQFSIPQSLKNINTPLASKIKLLINNNFHLMFSFVQFELLGLASCSGDLVLFRKINFYCGHKAP